MQKQNDRLMWFAAISGGAAILAASVVPVAQAKLRAALPPAPTPEQAAFFEAKIRPILVTQCASCHGASGQFGGVRLDNAADTLKALIAGDPEKSRLIHVIRYDGKIKMPPEGKLPASAIAALTEWVKMGSPWPVDAAPKSSDAAKKAEKEGWWSFQPVKKQTPPTVKNAAWATTPVDKFVLAKLEAKNLTPAPRAGKRALIRRAYFDLVGLPPTPEQIEAFIADKSPDAFAKVVDSLLASPHFGERWARHWLDVARYADSNGLDENLAFAYAFRYRDWVVNALNKDKPYNAFLQEQLAGDLMDSGGNETLRNERLTATGFLTLGAKVLAEQDKPKLVMDIVDEQIDVTSKATMGLTIACARCHDHKFDPISTKDYYALAGIFKSAKTMKNLGFVSQVNDTALTTKELTEAQRKYAETLKPLEAQVNRAKSDAAGEVTDALKRDADKYIRAGAELARQPGVLLSVAETPVRPGSPERRLIEAVSFVRGNAVRDTTNYGKDLGVIVTDQSPVSAEYDVELPIAGRYQVELRYAAMESRPVHLLVNGKLVAENAAPAITGTWMPDTQLWEAQGIYEFAAGKNTFKIERLDGPLPHISRILLVATQNAAPPAGAAKPLSADDIARRGNLISEVVNRFAVRLQGVDDPQAQKAKLVEDAALFALPQKPETLYSESRKNAIKKAQDALEVAQKAAPQTPMIMVMGEEMKPEDVRVHLRGSTQSLGDVAPARLSGHHHENLPAGRRRTH